MRGFLIATNVLNFLLLLSFVFSFSYVFLNYTFVNGDLPDDNIPFFINDKPAKINEGGSGRYGVYWWLLASGVLRILVPFTLLSNIIFMKFIGPGFTIFVQLIVVGVLILEWIKFIWLIILWVPSNCKNHQFCRNFGARRELMVEIGDDPSSQNAVFTFEVYYTLAVAIMMIFYVALIGTVREIFVMTKKTKANAKIKPARLWGNVILGAILTLGLLFYLSIVFLNFTFTNAKTPDAVVPPDLLFNLPDGKIPYYINNNLADPTEFNSGRSELYWWFIATDTLLILVPPIILTTLVLEIFRFRSYRKIVLGSLVVLLLWQVIKMGWAIVLAFPSACAQHQFCRALGARRDGGGNEIGDDPGVWNSTYAAYMWFNIGFVVILILFIVVNMKTIFGKKKKKAAKKTRKDGSSKKKSKSKKPLLAHFYSL